MAGSKQMERYERAREFGHLSSDAAAYAGISIGEADLIEADREKAERKSQQQQDQPRPA
jgi:hypothetical protein